MKSILRSLTLPLGAALIGALTCAGAAQAANDHCFYKGTMSSDGALSCQSGAQFRCKDGDWKSTGMPCTPEEKVAASKPCTFSGISYSTRRRELSEREPVPLRGWCLDEPVGPVHGR